MPNLWTENATAASAEIRDLEHRIGHSLPDAYKALVTAHDGASLRGGYLVFMTENPAGIDRASLALIPFSRKGRVATMRDVSSLMGKGLVPFAGDGGGNYFVLDYRSSKVPCVAFVQGGTGRTNHVVVAEDFDAFIAEIRPDPEWQPVEQSVVDILMREGESGKPR